MYGVNIHTCTNIINVWTVTMHFANFISTILFKSTKIEYQKKSNPSFLKFWVGRKKAKKHLFFLGLAINETYMLISTK